MGPMGPGMYLCLVGSQSGGSCPTPGLGLGYYMSGRGVILEGKSFGHRAMEELQWLDPPLHKE